MGNHKMVVKAWFFFIILGKILKHLKQKSLPVSLGFFLKYIGFRVATLSKLVKSSQRIVTLHMKLVLQNIQTYLDAQELNKNIFKDLDWGKATNMNTKNICGSLYSNCQIFGYSCLSQIYTD